MIRFPAFFIPARISRLTLGGSLSAILCGLALAATPGAAAPELPPECPGYCICAATYKESKSQPGFNQSCIQSISVTVGSSKGGCCFGGFDHLECAAMNCQWKDVEITVTPSSTCKIRINVGESLGTPTTITSATSFDVADQAIYCEKDITDACTIQWSDSGGMFWEDIFELTFHCGDCPD